MYYYAELNDNDICIGVYESLTIVNDNNHIQIDSLNEDLIGLLYNRSTQTWETPSFSDLADHSTNDINYRDTDQVLSDVLDNKSNVNHTHSQYSPISHTHDIDDVNGLQTSLNAKANSNHTHSGYASATHSHAISNITGLQTALDSKASSDHTHANYATVNHTHSEYATNDDLDGKADVNHTHTGYAASSHTHAMSNITGLSDALNGKASTSHTHSNYATTTALNGKANASHTHAMSDVTGLSDALDGKSDSGHAHATLPYLKITTGNLDTRHIYPNQTDTFSIGTSGGRYKWIYSQNVLQTGSDARLKCDIEDVNTTRLINFIANIDLKTYAYKADEDKARHIGIIAQQLQEIDPEIASLFVHEGEDGMLNIGAQDLIYPLIACIQHLLKRT